MNSALRVLVQRSAHRGLVARRCFSNEKILTEETMNQPLRRMEYAVRGEVVSAADELQAEIEDDPEAHHLNSVLYTNVGNPHSVGQDTLKWPRQVMALCNLPDDQGIHHPEVNRMFPQDVIDRAAEVKGYGIRTGAYSHSQGHLEFREHIAEFIEKRDGGVKAHANHIFMTNGASTGIEMILQTLLADETW